MLAHLFRSTAKDALYTRQKDRIVFENPLYNAESNGKQPADDIAEISSEDHMRLRDFLASMPSFADFTDQQLLKLEQKAVITTFSNGDIVFKQGDEGDNFYILHKGTAEVCIQPSNSKLKKGDIGKVCNNLTGGMFFGERALMTTEKRAATIRISSDDTVCLVFSKEVYESVISNSSALIGNDVTDTVDWSKDHETRSLFKHIEKILEIASAEDMSVRMQKVAYELTTVFTPELCIDDLISRMVIVVKQAVKADRVGLFVISDDRQTMVLKVSEKSKGIRLPVKGLAGLVLETNQSIMIEDAQKDKRFDDTMDKRSGYRTRQVICVPVRHPVTGDTMGTLQVNNRQDESEAPFEQEDLEILKVVAEQLSELLHGRADVFVHMGSMGHSGETVVVEDPGVAGDSMKLLHSADIDQPVEVELLNLTLCDDAMVAIALDRIPMLEVTISLNLALNTLCPPRVVYVDVPEGGRRKKARKLGEAGFAIHLANVVEFDIDVKDLPRACRVLFTVKGIKKKNLSQNSAERGNLAEDNVFLGWAAAPCFDFKGCLDAMVDLRLFPTLSAGEDKHLSMHTHLNNDTDPLATNLSAVMCSNLVEGNEEGIRKVRMLHTMPVRQTALDSNIAAGKNIVTDAEQAKLKSILLKSFSPVATTLLTVEEKEFIWDHRYNIMNKAAFLPAFIMSVSWKDSRRVQELYDLLDLWDQSTPMQALQLLDRRFMDPKIRAYAVHLLEDLSDDDLALLMLQLCQQLKFENHVDSALSRFLLRRALQNLRLIGHIFFWFLQSEVYNVDVRKRYVALLQIYLRKCEHHRVELGHQMFVMKRLESVAEKVCAGKTKTKRLEILRETLRTVVLPPEFQLPLNPHIKIVSIVVDKCRVMESKKKPLWLVLKDSEDRDIVLMLKVGDDLRQDALTLQLLKVMDSLWKKEGLDMQMMLYGCISTGDERGLLQVVLNATTIASIMKDAQDNTGGGKEGSATRKIGSALKAFGGFTLLKEWIWKQVCNEVPLDEDCEGK